jgi:hypothetical protein
MKGMIEEEERYYLDLQLKIQSLWKLLNDEFFPINHRHSHGAPTFG